MEEELTKEEREVIKKVTSDAETRLKAMMSWQDEHKEEVDKILDDAAGSLSVYTSALQSNFPLLKMCDHRLVVGAFQTAYLTGYLRAAKVLDIDK